MNNHSQTQEQTPMVAPVDDLIKISDISYTPPKSWGTEPLTDKSLDQTVTPPSTSDVPLPNQIQTTFFGIKTVFTVIALILFGILIGILAARFIPRMS